MGTETRGGSAAKKLLQAAALAAALVPLGAIDADAAPIECVSNGGEGSGGCFGDVGTYAPDGEHSNVWKFYQFFDFETQTFDGLIYTFEITGTPTQTFSLEVFDFVTTQDDLLESGALELFPGAECTPTFDASQCGLFDVYLAYLSEPVQWQNDQYDIIIRWMSTASSPPDDGRNHILRAGDHFLFNDQLVTFLYDNITDPIDPALGGRGDTFSRFGAFRTAQVPEPATLVLLGTGLAAAALRRRRRS